MVIRLSIRVQVEEPGLRAGEGDPPEVDRGLKFESDAEIG